MDDNWNNWKKLFDLVGVTEDQMLTKGTLDFLYCFVRKRGGVNNVIRELEGDPLVPTGNHSSFHGLLINGWHVLILKQNRTSLVRFSNTSGAFSRNMVRILASVRLAKIPMASLNEP